MQKSKNDNVVEKIMYTKEFMQLDAKILNWKGDYKVSWSVHCLHHNNEKPFIQLLQSGLLEESTIIWIVGALLGNPYRPRCMQTVLQHIPESIMYQLFSNIGILCIENDDIRATLLPQAVRHIHRVRQDVESVSSFISNYWQQLVLHSHFSSQYIKHMLLHDRMTVTAFQWMLNGFQTSELRVISNQFNLFGRCQELPLDGLALFALFTAPRSVYNNYQWFVNPADVSIETAEELRDMIKPVLLKNLLDFRIRITAFLSHFPSCVEWVRAQWQLPFSMFQDHEYACSTYIDAVYANGNVVYFQYSLLNDLLPRLKSFMSDEVNLD